MEHIRSPPDLRIQRFYEFGGLKGERKFLVCKWKKGNGISGGV